MIVMNCLGLSISVAAVLLTSAVAHADADVKRLLGILPDDAVAFFAVPHVRHLSDAAVQSLDGMDRTTATFGSRPIDQLKSMLGLTVAVNELQPAAMALVPRGDDEPGVEAVWLVPVTNPVDFLTGNFHRTDDPANDGDDIQPVQHRRFGALYAKSLDEHVAMAKQRRTLEAWRATGKLADELPQRMSDVGRRTLRSGDIVMWVSDLSCERWGSFITDGFDRLEARWPALEPVRTVMSAVPMQLAVDGIVAIDLDPLGLFIRSWWRIEGEVDPKFTPPAEPGRHLRSLPRRPHLFGLAMDQRGMMMSRVLCERLGWNRMAQSFASVRDINQIDVAAYKDSPAGVMGRAVAVLRGEVPGISIAITEAMLPWQAASHDRVWRESSVLTLQSDARVHEYAVRLPPEVVDGAEMLLPLLFGPAGWQGYVVSEDQVAVMTFSRARPWLDSTAAMLNEPDRSVADDPVVRSMLGWLPESPAVVGFVNVGTLMEQIQPMIQPMLSMLDVRLPDAAPGLPPVAAAVATDGTTVEATIIVPSGVLAIGYDLASDRFIRQRFLTPKKERDGTMEPEGK